MSYRLREELEKSRMHLEPDASLFSADSVSFRLARREHSSSTHLSIGSVACLILLSIVFRVSSALDVSSVVGSMSISCRSFSSRAWEELSLLIN